MINTVLFDLDGTLADTAPDLAYALNLLLSHKGQAPLAFEQIRPVVSHGGRALIELGFGLSPDDVGYEDLRQEFLQIYLQNLARETRLFPGMEDLLKTLEQKQMRWGVVTNKPSWLTDPLMQALNLHKRAATIISGDTAARAKPFPDPILLACEQTQSTVEQCIYLGDAERDVQAAKAANMSTMVCLFGYIGEHEHPREWAADIYVEQVADIYPAIQAWGHH